MKLLIAMLMMSFQGQAQDMEFQSFDRDPAAIQRSSTAKRTYPGGADEEDLRVQARLPEAVQKGEARSIQKDVYKTLFNKELKDEGESVVEE